MRDVADSTLTEFFARLDGGDAEAAAQFFAVDALYVRPAADVSGTTGTETEVVAGRAAIREFFGLRGRRPYAHQVRTCVRAGDVIYGDGVAVHESLGPFVVFLARATIDDNGHFRRYVAGTVAMSPQEITLLYS
jgi:hypothetical protein